MTDRKDDEDFGPVPEWLRGIPMGPANPRNPQVAAEPGYEVGYGRPPKATQFKKGEPSANPKGRPKRNKDFQRVVVEQLNMKTTVTIEGRRRRLTLSELSIQQLARKAAGGDVPSIKLVVGLAQAISPLRPEPTMSPEEERKREEMVKKLHGLLVDSLDAAAARRKLEGEAGPSAAQPGPETN